MAKKEPNQIRSYGSHVKAGSPDEVMRFPAARVDPTKSYRKSRPITSKETDTFLQLMQEGFLSVETTRKSIVKSPGWKIGTWVRNTRVRLAKYLLPEEYMVTYKRGAPRGIFPTKEYVALLRKLWDGYEPRMGRRTNTTAVLQVDEPEFDGPGSAPLLEEKPSMAPNLTLKEDGRVIEKEKPSPPPHRDFKDVVL